MIHLMIDPRTGETVRFMQNDIVSVPTLEKGARLYITKKPIWIATVSQYGMEIKQRLFMVDFTDPATPFVRSMYLTQIARIDEEGTTVEKRKQGKLAFTDMVNTKIHRAGVKNSIIAQLCAGKFLTVADTKTVKVHKYDQTAKAYTNDYNERFAYSWKIEKADNIDDEQATKIIMEAIERQFTKVPPEEQEQTE